MNYIGSKQTLLPFIDETISSVIGNDSCDRLLDPFAGTGAVSVHYKKKGYSIIANDIQYFNYVRLRHYVENCKPYNYYFKTKDINHDRFMELMDYFLDNGWKEIPSDKYMYVLNTFANGNFEDGGRLYFSEDNARKIDGFRHKLCEWMNGVEITYDMYFLCLTMLLEAADKVANVASIYGAYLKKLKATARKTISFTEPELILSDNKCMVYNEDANQIVRKVSADILYLDPPYNHRQYASNYHVLETIAKYDNPKPNGKTGVRDWVDQKSLYCMKNKAYEALDDLVRNADCKYIFLSYNNEGILSFDEIRKILSQRGGYGMAEKDYHRFKADNNREYKSDTTTEYLHYVRIK